jgi:ADP-ribose pyrophosphatase
VQAWKPTARVKVLERPSFLIIENHMAELPDGRTIPDWPWVITPDYINVVAITDQKTFVS